MNIPEIRTKALELVNWISGHCMTIQSPHPHFSDNRLKLDMLKFDECKVELRTLLELLPDEPKT